jgi:hypothetical protein
MKAFNLKSSRSHDAPVSASPRIPILTYT